MKRKRLILLTVVIVFLAAIAHVYFRQIYWPKLAMKAASPAMLPHPVIAHRGASYLAPEETEPAFALARDLGVDYLELDIQRTKDHVLVAMHDDTVARTTNAAQVFPGREKKNVEDFTLAELKQLDAGSWFNKAFPQRARPKFAGVKVLTLEEILTIAESGTNKPSVYIETKSPHLHPGYEAELVDVLKRHNWLGKSESGIAKTIFQSFSIDSLRELKKLAPDTPSVYLIGEWMPKEIGWDKMIADAKEVGCGIGPVAFIAWPWNVAKAHNAALYVHAYTVDYPIAVTILSALGVDAVFTNRCELMLPYYGRKPAATPDAILSRCGF